MVRAVACCSILGALLGALSPPQLAARPDGPAPSFAPGLYETESRNAAFPDQGVKSTSCILSADLDAFRRETIAQFRQAPQFRAVCKLSPSKPISGGFGFAMDCNQAQTIIAYTFRKGLVSSVTRTRIASRPEYSSTILTLSRRIGDCPRRKPGERL